MISRDFDGWHLVRSPHGCCGNPIQKHFTGWLSFSFRRSILLPQPLPTFRTPSLRMKPSLWNCAMGSVASLAQAGIADPHCGSATPACAQHHDHCTTQPKLLTAHFLTSGFDETPPPMERRHFFGHPGFLNPRFFSCSHFFVGKYLFSASRSLTIISTFPRLNRLRFLGARLCMTAQ